MKLLVWFLIGLNLTEAIGRLIYLCADDPRIRPADSTRGVRWGHVFTIACSIAAVFVLWTLRPR